MRPARRVIFCVHCQLCLHLPSINSMSNFHVVLFHLYTSNEIMPRNQELEQTMNSQRHQKCTNEKGYGWAWISKRVAVRVLVIMYQSNQSFNIPLSPGNPPGIWIFGKSLFKFPCSSDWKAVQMSPPARAFGRGAGAYFTDSGVIAPRKLLFIL